MVERKHFRSDITDTRLLLSRLAAIRGRACMWMWESLQRQHLQITQDLKHDDEVCTDPPFISFMSLPHVVPMWVRQADPRAMEMMKNAEAISKQDFTGVSVIVYSTQCKTTLKATIRWQGFLCHQLPTTLPPVSTQPISKHLFWETAWLCASHWKVQELTVRWLVEDFS